MLGVKSEHNPITGEYANKLDEIIDRKRKMKQIFLKEGENPLTGKVIKDMSYLPHDDNSKNIIFTFTDDTYIFLEAEFDDDDRYETALNNGLVLPFDNINCGVPGWVDSKGEFHYDKNFQEWIRLGIAEDDIEHRQKIVEERKVLEEKREYEQYLRLKEKYDR